MDTWLEEAVKACGLPPSGFPRDVNQLRDDIGLVLPLTVVALPRLTSELMRQWLVAHKRAHRGLPEKNRRLRGCMVAMDGEGMLFYDGSDDEPEKRFTLAHEVSHFVLDHLLPQVRAQHALGPGIMPVFKGRREPTIRERLFSVLDRVSLHVQVNHMDRSPDGDPLTGRSMESEWRADRLAFELLAPEKEVRSQMNHASSQAEVEGLLVARFGLPVKEARSYARMLYREDSAPPSFLDFMRVKRKGG